MSVKVETLDCSISISRGGRRVKWAIPFTEWIYFNLHMNLKWLIFVLYHLLQNVHNFWAIPFTEWIYFNLHMNLKWLIFVLYHLLQNVHNFHDVIYIQIFRI